MLDLLLFVFSLYVCREREREGGKDEKKEEEDVVMEKGKCGLV